jgi:AraC-like DNA-binding protein
MYNGMEIAPRIGVGVGPSECWADNGGEAMTALPEVLTATPPDTALDAVLARLRLDGAIFFRSEFTEAWCYTSPTPDAVAAMLRPGAPRLIMFHIVARGRCWVAVDDGVRHWAGRGDVIVLPYGDQHEVGGVADAATVPILSLFDPPPWERLPVLRHGAGGEPTDLVCGYLHSTDPLFDPALAALPRVFVARTSKGPAADWVRASIDYAVAMSEANLPDGNTPTRLPELLLIEVLRWHLASAPAIRHGWLAALRDPVLAPALAAIHADPARKWVLADLARAAAMSRSALDERFRQLLGRSPIRYLHEWRMHVAGDLLRSTDFSVARISRQVGYDSEEAFSRAFKRLHGEAPGRWRAGTRDAD